MKTLAAIPSGELVSGDERAWYDFIARSQMKIYPTLTATRALIRSPLTTPRYDENDAPWRHCAVLTETMLQDTVLAVETSGGTLLQVYLKSRRAACEMIFWDDIISDKASAKYLQLLGTAPLFATLRAIVRTLSPGTSADLIMATHFTLCVRARAHQAAVARLSI